MQQSDTPNSSNNETPSQKLNHNAYVAKLQRMNRIPKKQFPESKRGSNLTREIRQKGGRNSARIQKRDARGQFHGHQSS